MAEYGIKVEMTAQDEVWVKARSRKEAEQKIIKDMEQKYPGFDVHIDEVTSEAGNTLVWNGNPQ